MKKIKTQEEADVPNRNNENMQDIKNIISIHIYDDGKIFNIPGSKKKKKKWRKVC